eukprot:TRINITY_DN727_c0_g1_i6.p1 TRINITY_DN727_c0_g1~~TRINITY_DN727_c0_g1_i6.p1  ORF type:complete len:401 (+),score=110.58 TRINITY_DN727_c0_g1_i6:219-1421(+)
MRKRERERKRKKEKEKERKKRLHVERSILGLPSGDIPSLVVEVYLRVKGVPFGIDNAAHRLQSPTGEMPFLSGIPKDEEETEEVNDGKSGACRASERKIIACGWRECVEFIELQGQKEERSAGGEDPVDESKPLQEFLIRFCEQELGFSLIYHWWVNDENYREKLRWVFRRHESIAPVRLFTNMLHRRRQASMLDQQGFTQNGLPSDIVAQRAYHRALRAYEVLNEYLGDNLFFLNSSEPSLADCVVFGYLCGHLYADVPDRTLHELLMGSFVGLVSFCERMRQSYFPDFEFGVPIDHNLRYREPSDGAHAKWNAVPVGDVCARTGDSSPPHGQTLEKKDDGTMTSRTVRNSIMLAIVSVVGYLLFSETISEHTFGLDREQQATLEVDEELPDHFKQPFS